MKKTYSNVRGTSDFNVSQSLAFRKITNKALGIFKSFCYEEIILPILEEKDVFIKGVGEVTDIVQKQMFKIEGKDIVLRPEATAQVVRYYIQNSLHKQSDFHKFFYIGPMFRGERPQRGRLRQFHHIGAEAIGSKSIYLDAEIIALSLKILDAIGVKDAKLHINSLGCREKGDKKRFAELLKKDLSGRKNQLCEDCQRRAEQNPLRVLDCKKKQCRDVVRMSSLIEVGAEEYLCKKCFRDFQDLIGILGDLEIPYDYKPDPYLVRGLDYYTNTVFEITSSKLGAQDAIGAGGRYNNLISSLGGPDKGAVGFALGLERIFLALDESKIEQKIDIFIATSSNSLIGPASNILNKLRNSGLACDFDYCDKSLKGQMRLAQKKGVRFVVIVADDEYNDKKVVLKDMKTSGQETISIDSIFDKIHRGGK